MEYSLEKPYALTRKLPLETRLLLVSYLGDSNSLKAAPLLLARFQDSNEREDLRQMSAFALGTLGATTAIPAFRAVLNDPNERTEARNGAIEGLKALYDTASIDLLLNRLQDPEERLDIRSNIVNALGTLAAHSDDNRNPALLRIALDSKMSTSIRTQALFAIQPDQQNQLIDQALIPLTQDLDSQIRLFSTDALLRVLEGEALLPWLTTPELITTDPTKGLSRYVATSPRAPAIASLLRFAQDDQSPLQAYAYKFLAELKATEALPVLQSGLATLEDEYQEWRQLRDQQPDDLGDTKAYARWQTQFKAATPKHAPLAVYYGYALAAMGFEQALTAFNHDLAAVRLGASFSLGKYASIQDLQALAQERAKHPNEPLFQQASYTAINQGLQRLERSTDPEQIQALNTWHAQTQAQATDPIIQRLAWTLTLIKHYQSLDQEFASKYQLKRKAL